MKVRRVNWWPDEWIAGTVGMSLEEEGLFCRMVQRYYSHGGPLPADPVELAKLCGVRAQLVRRLLPKLREKFEESGGKLRSNRCESELKLAENRMETARFNGSQSRKNKEIAEAGAFSPSKQNEKLPTNYIEEEDSVEANASTAAAPPSDPAPVDPVKELWDRGLAVLGGNRALLGKLRKQHGDVAVIEAIAVCEREMPSEPASFLVACLSRAGPANSKSSPTMKLYEGAARAVEAFVQRGIREGLIVDDNPPLVPLLDSGRSPGEPASADRGLA